METEKAQTALTTWDNTPIGVIERPKLEPTDCVIEAVEKKEGVKNGRAWAKLVLHLKHPGRDAALNVSDAKVETKGALVIKALFLNVDAEGKIEKGSPVALLLQYYNAPTIASLVGKTVKTAQDEKGFLCIKAY
jgi:hypothetical protein